MTDNQAKSTALQSVGRMHIICRQVYPYGLPRQLIWVCRSRNGEGFLICRTPVICDNNLVYKVLDIEKSRDFVAWGLNPWTGLVGDLRLQ